MKFQPVAAAGKKKGRTKGKLHVLIQQARNLATPTQSDLIVKCSLLPAMMIKKSLLCNPESIPFCSEDFTFETMKLEELASAKTLEVTVCDERGQFLRGLRLGPAPRRSGKHKEWIDSVGEEVGHWELVVAHPGEWQEAWHTLKTNMDSKKL